MPDDLGHLDAEVERRLRQAYGQPVPQIASRCFMEDVYHYRRMGWPPHILCMRCKCETYGDPSYEAPVCCDVCADELRGGLSFCEGGGELTLLEFT